MRGMWGLFFLCLVWVGCSEPRCGDGIVDASSGEECDDGCQVTCLFPGCGDGVLSLGEECDDGNNTNDDGCQGDCTFTCQSPSDCSDDNACTTDSCVSNRCQFEALNPDDDNPCTIDSCDPTTGISNEPENDGVACTQPGGELGFCFSASCEPIVCGDGFESTGEECDDGNNSDADSCTNVCQLARCGDGFVLTGTEECDDGNNIDGDACNSDCSLSIIQLAAGRSHTCALLSNGAVRCWGFGGSGRLGYGNTNSIGDNETPASAGDVNLGGSAIQLAAGGSHTCALLSNGSVRCWGFSGAGTLGYGNTNSIGNDETPASAGDVPLGGSAIQLTAGNVHTCALLSDGAVRCWGFGGRLGYGNTNSIGDNETPASAGDVNLGGSAVQLAAGGFHTCALLNNGAVRCWGAGGNGQLGYGNTNSIGDDETPASADDVPLGGSAIQLTAGNAHTCALLSEGSVRCWGFGGNGQLGYGNTDNIGDGETPASADDVPLGGSAIQLTAGNAHTCALLSNGSIRCWGDGTEGQLGYGNTDAIGDDETPVSAGDVFIF